MTQATAPQASATAAERGITDVAIIGAGTMGAGIATAVSQAPFQQVTLIDINPEVLDRAQGAIESSLSKFVQKGKLSEADQQAALGRLKRATTMDAARSAQFVIEAVPEDLGLKTRIFRQLNEVLAPGTLLASNTSSLPIAALAQAYQEPQNVLGVHFFNPVPLMQLVEVIRGPQTAPEAVETALAVIRALGKTPVDVKDSPGFVVNRILIPLVNEAAQLLGEGVASAEDIDTAMKLGANHPMGPLALGDLIGLDVCLAIMETLRDGIDPKQDGTSKYEPARLLREKVAAGLLGRKTGEGFFRYREAR